MAQQINVVIIGGNLTSDPELRHLPSGMALCKLRIANNRRRKVGDEWKDAAGFFDVTVWGKQGENCNRYLSKGRPVMVRGELRWREWETPEGQKRQAVEINADEVQFLSDGQGGGERREGGFTERLGSDVSDVPSDIPAPATTTSGYSAADDDIPFVWEGPRDYEDRYHASRPF